MPTSTAERWAKIADLILTLFLKMLANLCHIFYQIQRAVEKLIFLISGSNLFHSCIVYGKTIK